MIFRVKYFESKSSKEISVDFHDQSDANVFIQDVIHYSIGNVFSFQQIDGDKIKELELA